MRCLSPNLRAGSREGERKRSAGSSLEARTQRPAWEPGLPIGTPAHKLDPCTSIAGLPIGASAQIPHHSGTPAVCTSVGPLYKYCRAAHWNPCTRIASQWNPCPFEPPCLSWPPTQILQSCTDPAMWQREDLLDIWREQTKQSRGLNILVGCAGQL